MGLIFNLILSCLVMGFIGWQAKIGAFPFCDWRTRKPQGVWDWLNCFFTVYNLYAFVTTWIALGSFTTPAVAYAIIMIAAFMIGWNWLEVQGIIQSIRTLGLKYVITDKKDRLQRKFRSISKKR